MDTRTGRLMDGEALKDLPVLERSHFFEVKRDLTQLELAAMEIRKYSPCGCGSGRKFKFCCFKPGKGGS